MKLSSQYGVLMLLGSAFLWAGIFQKPLGLPEWAALALLLIGAVVLWCAVFLSRRAQKRPDTAFIPPTPQQYKKRIGLMLVSVIFAALAGPFVLPYMVPALSFYQGIIVSAATGAICVTTVLVGARLYGPKASPGADKPK